MKFRHRIGQIFNLIAPRGSAPQGSAAVHNADYWRERILDIIYRSVALLGGIAYVPSVILAAVERLWWLVALNTLGYAWFVAAAVSRRVPSPVRSTMLLAFIYFLGVALLINLGPFAAGPIWLFAFPIMTSLLFGLRPAVAALVLNALTVIGFGAALSGHHLTIGYMPPHMDDKWWVISANFLLLDTVVTLSIGALLRGLDMALDQQREMRRSLEEKHRELQKATANLRQAQKMEAIGTLAGGIAHDFNNILAAILGYGEIALEEARGQRPLEGYLGEILKASNRAKDLTRQILTFSRQTEIAPKPVRLSSVVREAVNLLRATLPTTISIRAEIRSDATVMADPTQLHQVVMNLATNAAHAMEDRGGELSIALEGSVDGPTPGAAETAGDPRRFVQLKVADTGPGIDPSFRDRIFDPFFTTKSKEKGTGMGLSVVHGIIQNCGGDIQVESAPGEGAVFSVYLPAVPIEDPLPAKPPLPEAVTGEEKVMVVDDEPQVAQVMALMLESLGYRVAAYTSSREALRTIESEAGAPDLLITDMTMPELTGEALARAALVIRPDLPIILCTGFNEHMTEERARSSGIRRFLYKPIVRQALAEVVREVLDQR